MRASILLALVFAQAAEAADVESLLQRAEALTSVSTRRESLAIPIFREALRLARAQKSPELEGRALVGLAGALWSVHEYAEAWALFDNEAIPLARRHGLRDVEFIAMRRLAGMAGELGRFDEGLRYCDQALRRAREWNDPPKIAAALNNIAAIRRRQGELELALQAIEQALPILDANRDVQESRLGFSIPYLYAGVLLDSGEFPRALEALERARKAAEATQNLGGIWHCLTDTALWYRLQGDLPRAALLYERALVVSRRVDSRDMEGLTLRGIADMERAGGDLANAAKTYAEALQIYVRHGIEEDRAAALIGLGATRIDLGDLAGARRELETAVELATRIGQPISIALARLELGRLALRERRLADGVSQYESALELAERLGFRSLAPSAYAGLASAARASGDLRRALSMFEKSDAAIARLRVAIPSAEQRAAFAAATHATYAGWIDTLLDAGRAEEALLVVERERSRGTMEAISTTPIAARARDVEHEIARIQLRLSLPTLGARERAELLARLDDHEHALVRAEGTAQRSSGPARSLEELRRALRSDEAYVALHRDRAFVLTPASFRVVRLAPGDQFENRVAFFTDVLQSDPSAARKSGERLAREVVAPWRTLLGSDTKRLLVSRSGAFSRIPLPALPVDGAPLVAAFEIDDVPSLSALAAARSRRVRGHRILAIGSGVARRVAVGGDSYALPPLPFARKEIETVEDASGDVQVLFDAGAAEQALKRMQPGAFGVIHFAAHAFLDPRIASRSAIVLAPGGTDDGLLQTREVRQLRLDSALVVLSSCQTAIGPVSPAESMHSLGRAFLDSGVHSVVATFWDVGDASTSRFIARFYRGLARGMSAGAALRAAQLQTMARDPYANAKDWAAFTIIGDGAVQPLEARRPTHALLLAGLVLSLIGIAFFLRRR